MLLKTEMRELFPEITSAITALTSHQCAPRYIAYYPATNHVTTRILHCSTGVYCVIRFTAQFNVQDGTLLYRQLRTYIRTTRSWIWQNFHDNVKYDSTPNLTVHATTLIVQSNNGTNHYPNNIVRVQQAVIARTVFSMRRLAEEPCTCLHCTIQASLCQVLRVDVTSHVCESNGLDSNSVRRYLKTCLHTKKLTVLA
jgi:hypothetical protein